MPPTIRCAIARLKPHLTCFVTVLVASKLGTLLLLTRGTVVCPFWPASGVALYWVLRHGARMWPGLWAGVLASNLWAGDPSLFNLVGPVGNLAETLAAAALVRRCKVDMRLITVRDIVKFALVAPWLAPVISAAGGMALLCTSGCVPWDAWAGGTALWWLANAMGTLVVTPALLAKPLATGQNLWRDGLLRGVGMLLLACLALLWLEAFWPELRLFTPGVSMFFAMWMGIVGGMRGAALGVSMAMLLFCSATALGFGYFVRGDAVAEALALAGFGLAAAVTLLPLGAVVEELKLEKTRSVEAEQAKTAQAVTNARLESLRSFLDPHLLFNAMAGLRATVRTDPEVALRYIEDLSRFLRLSLDAGGAPTHALRDELTLAHAFLAFHRHRCDLEPCVTLPDAAGLSAPAAGTRVPAGLIHSLLENAFKHGQAEADGHLHVRLTLTEEDGCVRLRLTHPGAPPPAAATADKPGGMRYLREQFQLLHGATASITLREDPPGTAVTEAVFPLSPATHQGKPTARHTKPDANTDSTHPCQYV